MEAQYILIQPDYVTMLNIFHEATKTDSWYANSQQWTFLLFTNNSGSIRWKLYDEDHCKLKECTRCPSLCRKRHIIIFTTAWFIPCIIEQMSAIYYSRVAEITQSTLDPWIWWPLSAAPSWMTKWRKIGVFSINFLGNWDFDEDAEMSTQKTKDSEMKYSV